MNIEIIWQAIGFLALFIVFFAFKETNDRKLLIYLAIGSFVWSIHFWLLWLYAAAGINFFDVSKNLAGLKWKKNNYWIGFFVCSYILIWYISFLYTGKLFSFLPTLTSVLSTLWVLYFTWVAMRIFLISTLFIWFIYNFIGGSYAGMTSDIILIWATLYWIYKLKTQKRFSLISLFRREKNNFSKNILR
jgi:hypothetical protein